ncbi:MAG: radical SAM protein [Nitrososphaerota archaeon]|nr:radical SAM protein [Nitrososphaerota archaeon]
MGVGLVASPLDGQENTYTLGQFWDQFYEPTILERFDLLKEWTSVGAHEESSLKAALQEWFVGLASEDVQSLAQTIQGAVTSEDIDPWERSISVANIIEMVKESRADGRGDLLASLYDFWVNGKRVVFARPHPSKYLVELTNNCNLNCVMCGVGRTPYNPAKTMNLSFFERACRSDLASAKVIRLNGLGESTIIPNFHSYLDTVEPLPAELEIVTNLTTKDDGILRRLIDMDFMVFISCDAANPELLTRIRRGLSHERFLENVRRLSELSAKSSRDPLRTQIITTLLSSNYGQLPEIVELAARNRIGGVIANMQKGSDGAWMRRSFPDLVETFRMAQKVARKLGVQLMVPDQIEGITVPLDFVASSNHETCPTFREEAFIRYNGDVCPCNMMNPYVYGNLKRNTMDEILGGAPSQLFDYLMESRSRHPYCRNCYFLRRE